MVAANTAAITAEHFESLRQEQETLMIDLPIITVLNLCWFHHE